MTDPDEMAAEYALVTRIAKAVHVIWHDCGSREDATAEAARRFVLDLRSRHLWAPRWLARWAVRPNVNLGYRPLPERECCGGVPSMKASPLAD